MGVGYNALGDIPRIVRSCKVNSFWVGIWYGAGFIL